MPSSVAIYYYYSFHGVECWADLGTEVKVCSPCPVLCIAVAVVINTNAVPRVGFEPRISHTSFMHVTTTPLWSTLPSSEMTVFVSAGIFVGVFNVEQHAFFRSVQHVINSVIARHNVHCIHRCRVIVVCRSFAESSATEARRADYVPSV